MLNFNFTKTRGNVFVETFVYAFASGNNASRMTKLVNTGATCARWIFSGNIFSRLAEAFATRQNIFGFPKRRHPLSKLEHWKCFEPTIITSSKDHEVKKIKCKLLKPRETQTAKFSFQERQSFRFVLEIPAFTFKENFVIIWIAISVILSECLYWLSLVCWSYRAHPGAGPGFSKIIWLLEDFCTPLLFYL